MLLKWNSPMQEMHIWPHMQAVTIIADLSKWRSLLNDWTWTDTRTHADTRTNELPPNDNVRFLSNYTS